MPLTNVSWIWVWIPTRDHEKTLPWFQEKFGKDVESQVKVTKKPIVSGEGEGGDSVKLQATANNFADGDTEETNLLKPTDAQGEKAADEDNTNLSDASKSEADQDFIDKEDNSHFAEDKLEYLLESPFRKYGDKIYGSGLKELVGKKTVKSSEDGNFKLFQFCVKDNDVEDVLMMLEEKCGIGVEDGRPHTSVSVIVPQMHIETTVKAGTSEELSPDDRSMHHLLGKDGSLDSEGAHTRFYQGFYSTMRSRLKVAEVLTRIQAGAQFTFDYLMLLILAAVIAFFGLTENSSVVLVASMLVSPMMGPILAGIFGTVVKDEDCRRLGIRVESITLFLCILIGFILGLIYCPFVDSYHLDQFPTSEMVGRGRLRNLIVGVFVAIPSGAGVALGVLGGNSGSMVGVAISASLLPPAVNAGCLWALSLVTLARGPEKVIIGWSFNHTEANEKDEIHFFYPAIQTWDGTETTRWATETFLLGLISLVLTIINIVCIIIFGTIILKIKAVTPESTLQFLKPDKFGDFWKQDVKVAKDYYKSYKHGDGDTLLADARKALDSMGIKQKDQEGLQGTFLHEVFEEVKQDSDYINIMNWTAMPPATATSGQTNGSIVEEGNQGSDSRKHWQTLTQRARTYSASNNNPRISVVPNTTIGKRVSVDPRKSILTQRNVNHQRLSTQRILQRTISENNNGRPDRPHVHFEGINTVPVIAPQAQDQHND